MDRNRKGLIIMQSDAIIISDADMDKLSRLVRALKLSLFRDQQQLELLDQALESADVRYPEAIPRDVVMVNSRVRILDFDTGEKNQWTLVFPENAESAKGLISVFAPVGIAILGRRKGDVIEAKVPGGTRLLRVEHVSYRAGTAGKGVRRDRLRGQEPPSRRRIQKTDVAA
jgi:regulator of nucleoside diphosphate kinase